jgi:hypothetical protein
MFPVLLEISPTNYEIRPDLRPCLAPASQLKFISQKGQGATPTQANNLKQE